VAGGSLAARSGRDRAGSGHRDRLGGDGLADLAVVRAQADLFGEAASDPTVSRLTDALAADASGAVEAIRAARVAGRARVWRHWCPVGSAAATGRVVVDLERRS
jgi:hypothetical protein